MSKGFFDYSHRNLYVVHPVGHKVQLSFCTLFGIMHGKLTPWAHGKLPANISDYDSRGISLLQIQELSDFLQRLCKTGLLQEGGDQLDTSDWLHWEDISMEQTSNMIVKPAIKYLAKYSSKKGKELCSAEQSWSWVEIVAHGAQDPKIFVSFSLQSTFKDFIGSVNHLADDQGLTLRDNLWIGMFALEVLAPSEIFDLLNSPSISASSTSEATALFLDKGASILERSWCIFEMAIITDTATNRRRWRLREEIARLHGCRAFEVEDEQILLVEMERDGRPSESIPSEKGRLDWLVRTELAAGSDPVSVPWEEVRERIRLMKQGSGINANKPLLLCLALSCCSSGPLSCEVSWFLLLFFPKTLTQNLNEFVAGQSFLLQRRTTCRYSRWNGWHPPGYLRPSSSCASPLLLLHKVWQQESGRTKISYELHCSMLWRRRQTKYKFAGWNSPKQRQIWTCFDWPGIFGNWAALTSVMAVRFSNVDLYLSLGQRRLDGSPEYQHEHSLGSPGYVVMGGRDWVDVIFFFLDLKIQRMALALTSAIHNMDSPICRTL